MDEDLVYGKALASDVNISDEGNETVPMYQLVIVNAQGEEIRTYQADGAYVTGVQQENNMLVLTRAVKNGTAYTETTQDQIMSTNTEEDVAYGIATKEDDIKQTEILLRVGTTITDRSAQVVTAKLLINEDTSALEIPPNEDRGRAVLRVRRRKDGEQMADSRRGDPQSR